MVIAPVGMQRLRAPAGPPFSARTRELPVTAVDQSSMPAACNPAGRRGATSPVFRPDAGPAAAASRSCPGRSRAPAAGTPRRCRCRARTGCPAGPSGHPGACGPDDRPGRQQRLDPRPQLIRRDPRWLLALPSATISLKAITPVPRLFSGLS
jgi:hypothetical protein